MDGCKSKLIVEAQLGTWYEIKLQTRRNPEQCNLQPGTVWTRQQGLLNRRKRSSSRAVVAVTMGWWVVSARRDAAAKRMYSLVDAKEWIGVLQSIKQKGYNHSSKAPSEDSFDRREEAVDA